LAGSGLKGALRHEAEQRWGNNGAVIDFFGPTSQNASAHAGALSVSDGVLVAFPVRCLKRGFVYATSAHALARAARLLSLAHGNAEPWPAVAEPIDKACASSLTMDVEGKLILEAFEFPLEEAAEVKGAADWLAENAVPAGEAHAFFRDKLRSDLVVLPEHAFSYFVERATVVEPHVRIDDETGTADDRGLFYTENLPPESLLLALVMASRVRRNGGTEDAQAVMDKLTAEFDGRLVQIGGDATTGRGQVLLRLAGGEAV
jgi:CRISPR-associated protein Cmr4